MKESSEICPDCGSENSYREGCKKCRYYSPQNLPKADAYSLLAEVRAIAENCTAGLNDDYMDYQIGRELLTAMKVIKEKISEHFS